ncbi:MAG: MBL fold metallo-hydrolase [Candidatus Omnitrophota bacterium]
MLIKYLGHSCFYLKSDKGISVLTDPYKPGAYGGAIAFGPISEEADIAVISHEHEDHFDAKSLPNQPLMVRAACRAMGLEFDVANVWHDDQCGAKRGPNRITCFVMDDIRICHLGDLGHTLSPEQAKVVGAVDILFLPIGGTYTIGPEEADRVIESLQPKIVIPMHFRNEKCGFPMQPAESFLVGKKGIRRANGSEVIIHQEDLPKACTILYLLPGN